MYRYLRLSMLICLVVVGMSACNRVPRHARYIPKDAVVVAGVDIKSLTKKVAWNAITGSKLFKQMQERLGGKNAAKGFEDAGIDVMNTMYVYIKSDKRFNNSNRVTALIPLSDADKWETYIKGIFPAAAITQHNGRKEASLTSGMYAGWTNHLLIIMNVIASPEDYYQSMTGNADTTDVSPAGQAQMTTDQLSAEMDNAFNVSKENALTGNKHFTDLQTAGHDITFWMNYDQLVTQYLGQGLTGMMNGLTLPNTFWKDAAFTAGFDFEKGKIAGEMRYYTSADMKELGKELGGTNVDKEMIERLPAQNLDMMMALHMSPKGTKSILEKMGVLGFLNVALAQQNMDADYILDAVTGDMGVAINDFSLKGQQMPGDSSMGIPSYSSYKPAMNFIYVIKINKKENFDRLLKLAHDNGLAQIAADTYVLPFSQMDSVFLVTDAKYAVVANSRSVANAYLQGANKGQKLPSAADIEGHPFAMFFDMQQVIKAIDPAIMGNSPAETTMIAETKKLLDNMSVNGGAYSENDAFEYHMAINFMNKDENSLLQIMDFAMRVSDNNGEAANNN